MLQRYNALTEDVRRTFAQAARTHNVPHDLLLAMAWQETRFRHISGDGGKAHGILQINEDYHPRFDDSDYRGVINYGAQLVAKLYNRYGSWEDAVTAYNSGSACFEGNRPAGCARGRLHLSRVLAALALVRSELGITASTMSGSPPVHSLLGLFASGGKGWAVLGLVCAGLGVALLALDEKTVRGFFRSKKGRWKRSRSRSRRR